jgi:hypothetical protein
VPQCNAMRCDAMRCDGQTMWLRLRLRHDGQGMRRPVDCGGTGTHAPAESRWSSARACLRRAVRAAVRRRYHRPRQPSPTRRCCSAPAKSSEYSAVLVLIGASTTGLVCGCARSIDSASGRHAAGSAEFPTAQRARHSVRQRVTLCTSKGPRDDSTHLQAWRVLVYEREDLEVGVRRNPNGLLLCRAALPIRSCPLDVVACQVHV